MEDDRIVTLYLLRDEAAIRESAEKFGSRLRSLSNSIVNDYPSACECENDTYMQAWNTIPPHEPKNYLYAFLARITRHISIDLCRKRSRLKRSAFISELSVELEQCLPSPNNFKSLEDDFVLKELINGFLSTLSVQNRKLFLRRYWYLDSIALISKQFKLSESNVKTTLFRLRNNFRDYLEKEGNER